MKIRNKYKFKDKNILIFWPQRAQRKEEVSQRCINVFVTNGANGHE